MNELRRIVEAILFAAARRMELSEIAKLCKAREEDVLRVLNDWSAELNSSEASTTLVQDTSGWKLTVKDQFINVIKRVVSKTELPKSIMETLAVVAYKAPVLQSKVIKLRTNKAYDHLNFLEKGNFISREKSGRTKLIKLAAKFFEYFDIDPRRLKQKFTNVQELEKAIEQKEKDIEAFGIQQQKDTAERLENPQIVLHQDGKGKVLKQYDVVEKFEELLPTGVEVVKDTVGNLEVYDVPETAMSSQEKRELHKKEKHEHVEQKKEVKDEQAPAKETVTEAPKDILKEVPVEKQESPSEKVEQEVQKKAKKAKPRSFEGKGMYPEGVPPEMEKKIDERVKDILEGEKKEE